VVNESVTGKNERITSIDDLKYPSKAVVQKINRNNRANTPTSNMFYSAQNIDAALKEVRPPVNKLVTVGVWKPRINKKFAAFPISHSEKAAQVNDGVAKATNSLESYEYYSSPLILKFMRYYFTALGSEYSKPVNHNNHNEYLISALFSERLFEKYQIQVGSNLVDFQYDCIIYPSVGFKYQTDNLAIRPDVLDNDFKLVKVIEFEVETEFYDNENTYVLKHPELITLAKVKNYCTTDLIDNMEGVIYWKWCN
jgi:hypothetical protein